MQGADFRDELRMTPFRAQLYQADEHHQGEQEDGDEPPADHDVAACRCWCACHR